MCCSFLNTHYSHSDAAYLISVSKIFLTFNTYGNDMLFRGIAVQTLKSRNPFKVEAGPVIWRQQQFR